MGTGWRRAFCNTVHRDKREASTEKHSDPTPRFTRSEPTTPRLSCKTNSIENNVNLVSPRLHCKTTQKSQTKTPGNFLGSSNPSSPRSPFSILKNTLRLSRNCCGVCMQSLKTGQRMAIYTAECAHAFHFPCIASHVREQNALICPVCSTTWKDFPLLAVHKQSQNQEPTLHEQEKIKVVDSNTHAKHTPVSSPRYSNKTYADDEPLVTPRAAAKFVTIPEVKEAIDEEEAEEFKGFFTNPISSSDEGIGMCRGSRNMEVSLLPEAALISVGRTHDTYAVVLKVKAPRPPPPPIATAAPHVARRAPVDLVTVLDVSGNMVGAKLEMLKRAMRLVISSLGSADRLSIVAFSAAPRKLLPLTRMTTQGQLLARGIIERLACSHGTSMGEALKHATKVLEERRDRNPVASIILLSGGQDDTVPANNDSCQRPSSSTTRFAHVEIPVLSREPAEDAFTKCVGELLSVVVQDLRIQLGFASGSDPAEIMAVYSCNSQPTVFGSGCIRLGDLYAEEERELMVEIRVPKSTSAARHHVFSVKSCYRDPATQDRIYGKEQALLVPRPQIVRSGLPKIDRLRNSFICTRAIAESRRLMEHNELSSALPLLSSARDLLIQSRSESAGEYIKRLEVVIAEVLWRRQMERRGVEERGLRLFVHENGEPFTPTSAWRSAEKMAKMKNSFSRVNDLHGFENARF